ncbi:MAG: hypothetical protein B6I26_07140 [Desulfobacteraceae bacterium 4572_130]|nr:MAG: hypothetical protein B6I26_07140 [Desulfobacteraceae bacterium 4572_130]
MFFCQRKELSREKKLQRSYYEVIRDEMDEFVLKYSLVDSYNNFLAQKTPYPFVEIKELKPRAIIPCIEFKLQNSFLIFFIESPLDATHKKHIRYFDANKITKANLTKHKYFHDVKNFHRNLKYIESHGFFNFIKSLLPVDYALLIQPDTVLKKNYALTHFHVRIDWPIADAAEDLAKDLRYISKGLYEKGDKYAENIQKKFFEYYGMSAMAGGRRTAAIVGAQYLRKIQEIATIYVGSSESRTLLKIDEQGISKSVLVKFTRDEIRQIVKLANITQNFFKKNYVIAMEAEKTVCIFNTYYTHTSHAIPPERGRLRKLKVDTNWLTVSGEQILPRPFTVKYPPIPFKIIYS